MPRQWFGQRHGHEPVRSVIQLDDMDDGLRVQLWNELLALLDGLEVQSFMAANPRVRAFLTRLWSDFFGRPVDTLDDWIPSNIGQIRDLVMEGPWSSVYGLLEAVYELFPFFSPTQ